MSLANPTPLRIGMHGQFSGKDFQLIGRVVLGVTDAGETYYWNEFNLLAPDGKAATLVYEAGEHGGEWRMFTQFDPEYPMTAAEVATKRVGDVLNLTGTDVRVTLLDTSRVYRIEGQPPEGVAVGDEANYFNAEAGGLMQVVSWTGEAVEFFNGVNLAGDMVLAAFNLPSEPGRLTGLGHSIASFGRSDSSGYTSGVKFAVQASIVIILFLIIFGRAWPISRSYEVAPVKIISAGQPPLAGGAAGQWKDRHYRITAHAVVAITEVGAKWERHEYQLTDDSGGSAQLICGWKPGDKQWLLLTPLSPLLPPTARECAAKKLGDVVNVDGVSGPVREMFLATLRQTGGTAVDNGSVPQPRFGFLARSEYDSLCATWDAHTICFERGVSVPAAEVMAAFARPAGN